MGRRVMDRQPYYEAYDSNGNLVACGTSEEVAKVLGGKSNSVTVANKRGHRYKGFEIISPAIYRRMFDCYHDGIFVCSGTYEEIAEKMGRDKRDIHRIATPSARKRIEKNKREETKALILFEVEERRLEWLR